MRKPSVLRNERKGYDKWGRKSMQPLIFELFSPSRYCKFQGNMQNFIELTNVRQIRDMI